MDVFRLDDELVEEYFRVDSVADGYGRCELKGEARRRSEKCGSCEEADRVFIDEEIRQKIRPERRVPQRRRSEQKRGNGWNFLEVFEDRLERKRLSSIEDDAQRRAITSCKRDLVGE